MSYARAVILLPILLRLTPVPHGAPPPVQDDLATAIRSAQAAEQAGRISEARESYLVAATLPSSISDWLLRRALVLTGDSAGRAAIGARIQSPIVRARLLEAEATARERWGDLAGAAARYDSLGRGTDAFRIRLAEAKRPTDRNLLRHELAEYVARHAGTSESDSAMSLLFQSPPDFSFSASLSLARAAIIMRQPARAVPLYAKAFRGGLGGAEDRLDYGKALAQLGRQREAIAAFARITAPASLAAEARYQRASSEQQAGNRPAAIATLRELLRRYPNDSAVAPKALFFAGNLASLSGQPEVARTHWLDLTSRFPRHPSAGRAGFLAALVLWEKGKVAEAAEEWGRQYQLDPGADGLAAGYWAGRAHAAQGDRVQAEQLWKQVIARDSLSYYALASAKQLGVEAWHPAPAPDRFASTPALDSTFARIGLLGEVGMDAEAGWEREWLLSHTTTSVDQLLAMADGFRRNGQASIAVSLARRALKAGATGDARVYRLIFPLLHEDDVRRYAAEAGVSPSVVAALIRQESVWEPAAHSRVGAIGLMQLMPETAKQIARTLGVHSGWSADRLLDPSINIRFGARYLAHTLQQSDGDLNRALAGYNAGPNRVKLWTSGAAAADPELFIERISIPETRDYVRIVQRNVSVYRTLYPEATP